MVEFAGEEPAGHDSLLELLDKRQNDSDSCKVLCKDIRDLVTTSSWVRALATVEIPIVFNAILYCPACGKQHIDAPELCENPECEQHGTDHTHPGLWMNGPHRTHLCHFCGETWRPSDEATNGVADIETQGSNDSWCVHPELDANPAASGKLRDMLKSIIQENFDATSGTKLSKGLLDRLSTLYKAL